MTDNPLSLPNATAPTGIVLMNYGGPESLDDVRPYLENIFRDPLIIQLPWFLKGLQIPAAKFIAWRRAPYSIDNFRAIGGKSPLNENTEKQRAALEAELARRGLACKVVIAQRYWRPRAEAAVQELRQAGVEGGILLPLYPQYSRATTLSSSEDFLTAWKATGGRRADFLPLREYPVEPAMIDAICAQIRTELAQLKDTERAKTGLIFSAHGLPQKMIDAGDPYLDGVRKSAAAVLAGLGWQGHWDLMFQSRVGPVRWVRPYPPETIADFRRRGLEHAVVYPITFVSDHSETLYELDLLWGPQARAQGLGWHRVAALNDDPGFIRALADIVERNSIKKN